VRSAGARGSRGTNLSPVDDSIPQKPPSISTRLTVPVIDEIFDSDMLLVHLQDFRMMGLPCATAGRMQGFTRWNKPVIVLAPLHQIAYFSVQSNASL